MATVPNLGDASGAVDKRIASKHADYPFRPNGQLTTIIATSNVAAAVPLPLSPVGGDECVRLYNPGTVIVRVKFSQDGALQATAFDKGIPAGAVETFRVGPKTAFISTYSATAGALEVSCGFGL